LPRFFQRAGRKRQPAISHKTDQTVAQVFALNEHKDHQHNHQAGTGEPFQHRTDSRWNGPKREGFQRLHDDWTALIFGLCGLVTFVNFARHFFNSLLDSL
jgi:hypothetical protein